MEKNIEYFKDQVAKEAGFDYWEQLHYSFYDKITESEEYDIAAERYAAHVAERIIAKALEVINKHTKENCDDHTPYYGACVTCGSTQNWDVITDIEEMRDEIEALKINKD